MRERSAAWAAALGLVLGEGADRLRRERWWVLAAGGLLVWTLASRLWSVNPPQSLLEARRMVVYAAVVLALVVLGRRHSSRLLFWATDADIALLMLYALAHYLFWAPGTYVPFEGYFLSDPLGYANAAGILGAMGVLLSTGAVADSTSRWGRAAAAATVPLLALAVELSGSRASWFAVAIGLAATTSLHRSSTLAHANLAAVRSPTALAVWAGHYSRLGTLDSVSPEDLPRRDGRSASGDITGLVGQRSPPARYAGECRAVAGRSLRVDSSRRRARSSSAATTSRRRRTRRHRDLHLRRRVDRAAGPVPTGTITDVAVLLDVQGSADVSNISVRRDIRGTAAADRPGPPGRRRSRAERAARRSLRPPPSLFLYLC